MADNFTYDVFLSHSSLDKPRVSKLAERLKKAGLRVWFDEWVIKPGDDIYLTIEDGLDAARVQVLCLSPSALDSEWVNLERSTVLFRDPTNVGRRFVPLLLADCTLPDMLRRYRYVDFRQETQAAFDELLSACREETELVVAQFTDQENATENTGENEAAWEGIQINGVFYAWAGSLLALEDRDPIPPPASLLNKIERLGLMHRWANMNRMSHHIERGYAQVFATDRQTWRRPVMDKNCPLIVGRSAKF